jgi:hypothetical protein
MKFCINCDHSRNGYDGPICDRNARDSDLYDPVTGIKRYHSLNCATQRRGDEIHHCGPEGKFWIPKRGKLAHLIDWLKSPFP